MMLEELRRKGGKSKYGCLSKRWSYIGLLHIYGIHSRNTCVRCACWRSIDDPVCFLFLFGDTLRYE